MVSPKHPADTRVIQIIVWGLSKQVARA